MGFPASALPSYAEGRSPWRTAALVAAAIAALELLALLVIALAFVAKPFAHDASKAKASSAASAQQTETAASAATSAKATVAKLSRGETRVLVLNGNGVSGAAASAADLLRSLDYRIGGVADASRRDFGHTIVMFRPGFQAEAERLAKDLHLPARRAVPLDGMRPADLGRAQVALILGG